MNYVYKGKAKTISVSITMVLAMLVTFGNTGKLHNPAEFYKILTADTLTPAIKTNTNAATGTGLDTLPQASTVIDTLVTHQQNDTFDVKISRDTLSAPVYYHADDSVVVDVPGNKIMLYGNKTTTKYEANELTAPGITFDQKQNVVSAYYRKDSTGKVINYPTFKQADFITQSDSITFNMKTQKGITKGTYTQQGEMYVYGEKIKKLDKDVFFAYKSRITTCNLDTPHFAFVSKKIKFVNQKFAVTGPVHPEFEGVPLPVVLPFGIYPMYSGRHSGLIAPSFTSTAQFGIALERLGYYKVISDNWDATFWATLYSYGGWMFQTAPQYYKRYHYRGSFVLDVQKTKIGFKGDPDFSSSQTFKIRWNHSMDGKSRPGVSFSANVEAGSTQFNQNLPTSPLTNYRNVLTSSISYSKVWKDKPFNIAISANHDQNANLGRISVSLPTVNFNVNTLYPFRRKEPVGPVKWYENLGIALNSNVINRTVFYDTANSPKSIPDQIIDNMKWGVTHNVPITLSLPPMGPLQASPGISYSETWYQQNTRYSWNEADKKLDTTINKGFYTARDMSFSLGLATRIFGMFTFGKKSNVQAVRHEIRPTMSFSFKPDLNSQYYYKTQVDTTGRTEEYNVYRDNISSPYGKGRFAGISFGLDNNIQMKVRNKKDTSAEGMKKVVLIDGFSINGNYNFLKDSLKLSTLSISARSNLFNKINVSAGGSLDPYRYDTLGRQINRLVWKDKLFTLGRLTNANLSISTNIQGGNKDGKKSSTEKLKNNINPNTGMPMTEDQAEAAYIGNNAGQFTDFSIPWSLQMGVSVRFFESFNRSTQKFKKQFSSDINLSGSLKLTEKWQMSVSTFYNFSQSELGMVSLSIAREMHCWQMSISVSPVGNNKFFSINISPKSSLLRDVKINRTRYFFDNP